MDAADVLQGDVPSGDGAMRAGVRAARAIGVAGIALVLGGSGVAGAQAPVDTTPPTATPTGAWHDLADHYVNGAGTVAITLNGADAGSGVLRLTLQEVRVGQLESVDAPCATAPAGPCPATLSHDTTVDTGWLDEGGHDYSQTTYDLAGNQATSDKWTVFVDRTAPAFDAPVTIAATTDPATGAAAVTWSPATDPVLMDGSEPSGLAEYSFTYRTGGPGSWGPWSSWQSTTVRRALVPAPAGTQFGFQVRAQDGVANVGPAIVATLVASP
jgi:hypothetical protein